MIKHIVFFRVKQSSEQTKQEVLMAFKSKLDELKNKISFLQELQTGINFSTSPASFDLVLETVFASKEDLEAYKTHPDHLKLIEFLNVVKEEVAVVDYEF